MVEYGRGRGGGGHSCEGGCTGGSHAGRGGDGSTHGMRRMQPPLAIDSIYFRQRPGSGAEEGLGLVWPSSHASLPCRSRERDRESAREENHMHQPPCTILALRTGATAYRTRPHQAGPCTLQTRPTGMPNQSQLKGLERGARILGCTRVFRVYVVLENAFELRSRSRRKSEL
jgi:hypothetical protein